MNLEKRVEHLEKILREIQEKLGMEEEQLEEEQEEDREE